MQIGNKIKKLRQENGLTQEELANRCELSKGFISQLERDLTSPSIASLADILESLGTNLTHFFSDIEKEKIVFGIDDFFVNDDYDLGFSMKWIIPNAQKNEMEPILLTIQPDGRFIEDTPHSGQEFGYVLSGRVDVILENTSYPAKKGQSFYYASNKVHSLRNPYKRPAVVLMVATPPSF